jgi:hypothetical protein
MYVVVVDRRLAGFVFIVTQQGQISIVISRGTCSNEYAVNRYVPKETSFEFCSDSLYFALKMMQ